MRKYRKINRKCTRLTAAVLCGAFIAVGIVGCGRKTEAVITPDGEEITEAVKEYETLGQSSAKKFSYDDLTVGAVHYKMKESQVKVLLGEPSVVYDSQEKDKTQTDVSERIYSYNDLTLVFSKIGDEYILTAAASVRDEDLFSRGLRVGNTLDDILKAYYRDSDCMNKNYYSQDKSVLFGKFLYGSYTIDSLDTVKPKGKVEYGLINLNGNTSLEAAESYIVEMTYFEPPYKNGTATVDDDFAQIAFDVDQNRKITAIRWYYYPQQD